MMFIGISKLTKPHILRFREHNKPIGLCCDAIFGEIVVITEINLV